MFEFNKNMVFKKFFLDNTYYFLISIFSLTLIVWVIQAVNYLDFVTEDGHGLKVYFQYMFFSIPKIISKLMLIIFFITIFYTITKFEDNNELKIFWLNGINIKNFSKNILKYSIIFMLIHILFNNLLVPFSQNKARTFIQSSNIDFFPSLINEKKFIDTVENLTIFIQEKLDNNIYKNIYLKDTREFDKTKIVYASKGILNDDEDTIKLILSDGKIINIFGDKITTFNFENTIFDLSNYLTKSTVDFKIQEKSTQSLLNCYINFHILKKDEYFDPLNCNETTYIYSQEELVKRLIKPFYYLGIAITVCFLFLFSKEKSKYKMSRLKIFLFGILILIISELITSLSGESLINLYISFFVPIVIFLFLKILLNKKSLNY